jgi:Zn-finger nucleic acid-binding protein
MTDVVPSPAARAAVTKPRCPHCREELQLGSWQLRDGVPLDCWACPGAHGVALTMAESYEQLQEDELARLWELARAGSPGPLPGPFGGPPMVRILLPYDDDEAREGEEGDAEDVGSVELDVDLDNQFIWFDAGELEQLPADLPDPEPSAEENAALSRITQEFTQDYGAALDARDDHEISERIYQRIARRPGMLRTFERLGRATTSY